MSRQTNHYGLSSEARALVKDLVALPDGERGYQGMFEGENYPLHRYVDPPATQAAAVAQAEAALAEARAHLKAACAALPSVYAEYVQDEPWSSGPCIFLALRGPDGAPVTESLWPQEDLDEA